jgi:ribonuclease P protein component
MPKPEVPIYNLRGFGAFSAIISNGNVITEKPLRLFYVFEKGKATTVSVGFAVTRNFRRAVDRNHIKRLMREAFRLEHAVFNNERQRVGELKLVIMYADSKTRKSQMVHLNNVSSSMHALLGSISNELTN